MMNKRNLIVIAGSALVVLLLVSLIVWRLRRSATEAETEATPTVSV